ncbi:hypothetical protein [Yersinia enterocolitica]|uniref:Prophage protein n=1 Tax=Yersinia enterocolitica TaxID=630 RepID=A0ABP1YC10_YEREN|nr:hypothetical protein [Yersinia enterocolitica]CNE47740.1 Uncharacterised protein [Yersinia enterocolitica]CQD62220.1 Uncharacterised protein [Yersinia enterocolitica]CRX79462.1 Uncharacterised protein [Yersinia enterocolitica]
MDKLDNIDLVDALNNISNHLETTMRLSLDPGAGVELADCIINYCANYAKRTAELAEKSLRGGK